MLGYDLRMSLEREYFRSPISRRIHTSSAISRPPGLSTRWISFNKLVFPPRGSRLITQLLKMQSIELDAMGRVLVSPACTKATWGGRRFLFLAFLRASLIISYRAVLNNYCTSIIIKELSAAYRRHIEPDSLSVRTNLGRCQENINATARSQVKNYFSLQTISRLVDRHCTSSSLTLWRLALATGLPQPSPI